MVSKASEDWPEPDSPVRTMSWLRGRSTSTFLRLWTRAPRTVIQSCDMSNSQESRRVPKLLVYHAIPQLGAFEAVREVERQPDQEPDAKPLPRRAWQPLHDEHAAGRRADADRPHERHAERTRPIGILVTEHQHADADQHEREQRADV